MNREEFAQHVEEALAHLYDHPYLETHTLARLLVIGRVEESRGHELQRLLLNAIEGLRPSPDVSYSSIGWRKYRYLHLRYVESLGAAQVAEELSVTPRHLRRSHREAITAVASVLWDRHPGLGAAETLTATDALRGPQPTDGGQSLLDQEVARMGGVRGLAVSQLGETIQGVLATAAPLALRRLVDVKVSVPDNLAAVALERTVLRQVLLNLLITAIEWSDGQVEVAVSQTPAGVEVLVWVDGKLDQQSDRVTGPPRAIPASSVSSAVRLDVSRSLVEKQGGTLRVDARAGGGRLSLCLPTAEPLTILVVDDNQDVITLFSRYLAGGPYRVISATNGADAQWTAREQHPALITLDVMMPSQDGWEVLQSLQAHPDTREIPVIVCSVLHEEELALLLGAADFLPKPVTQAALLEVLARRRPLAPSSAHRG